MRLREKRSKKKVPQRKQREETSTDEKVKCAFKRFFSAPSQKPQHTNSVIFDNAGDSKVESSVGNLKSSSYVSRQHEFRLSRRAQDRTLLLFSPACPKRWAFILTNTGCSVSIQARSPLTVDPQPLFGSKRRSLTHLQRIYLRLDPFLTGSYDPAQSRIVSPLYTDVVPPVDVSSRIGQTLAESPLVPLIDFEARL